MSKADLDRWEARYARPGPAQAVDPFLIEIGSELPCCGRALDVAGGAGRHALFLAGRGFDVTLVDISPSGLDLAIRRARDAGVNLKAQALDLDKEVLPEGPFDLVLCTSYLPSRRLWRQMAERIGPLGRLVYVQPTTVNLERHAHPGKRVLLEPGALKSIVASLGLEPLRLEEGWDRTGRHTARLLASSP